MNRVSIAMLCAALLLSGCADDHAHDADHDHAGHDHAGQAAHHAGHDAGVESITHFSDRTELFVEFPRLVAGEAAMFVAHVSRLSDFRALAAGQLGVRLSGGGQPDEVWQVEAPAEPGIFRAAAAPRHAGERELSVTIRSPEFSVVHELGPVTVHADRRAAAAEPAGHADAGIVFGKEQQWKADFATTEVITRPMRAALDATASVRARPDGEAQVSALMDGRLHAAGDFPRLGQRVQPGQVLAWLTPRLGGETDLATLRAAHAKAQVAHALAAQELARLEGLLRQEAVPERRVLDARAALASSQAELDATRQRLGQFSGAPGAHTAGMAVRAPVGGVLAEVRVTPGAFVQAGTPLFHIVDRRRLWLELRVPEHALAALGAPAGASFQVGGVTVELDPARGGARLVAVGGVVDPVTRTVPVVFEFAPDAPGLPAHLPVGLAVAAQVYTGAVQAAVAIPVSSVVDENGVPVVYVQTGGETFERRVVRLGARAGDWVTVLEGLTPGSRVVSRGAYLVKLAASGAGEIGHGHVH